MASVADAAAACAWATRRNPLTAHLAPWCPCSDFRMVSFEDINLDAAANTTAFDPWGDGIPFAQKGRRDPWGDQGGEREPQATALHSGRAPGPLSTHPGAPPQQLGASPRPR